MKNLMRLFNCAVITAREQSNFDSVSLLIHTQSHCGAYFQRCSVFCGWVFGGEESDCLIWHYPGDEKQNGNGEHCGSDLAPKKRYFPIPSQKSKPCHCVICLPPFSCCQLARRTVCVSYKEETRNYLKLRRTCAAVPHSTRTL